MFGEYLFVDYLAVFVAVVVAAAVAWWRRGAAYKAEVKALRKKAYAAVLWDASATAQMLADATQANGNPGECRLWIDVFPFEDGDIVRRVRCTGTVLGPDKLLHESVLIDLDFDGWDGSVIERSLRTSFAPLRHRRISCELVLALRGFLVEFPHDGGVYTANEKEFQASRGDLPLPALTASRFSP